MTELSTDLALRPLKLSELLDIGRAMRPRCKSNLFKFIKADVDGCEFHTCALGAIWDAYSGKLSDWDALENPIINREIFRSLPALEKVTWYTDIDGDDYRMPAYEAIFEWNDSDGRSREEIASLLRERGF